MHHALLVHELSVSLRGRALVDKVSFTIAPGESLALLGASGSGKSLTAAALAGHLPAGMHATGRLEIDGKERDLGERRIAGTGVAAIHQDPLKALNPLVRLGKQLGIPLRSAGLTPRDARSEAARLLLSVGLQDTGRILSSFSGELSGGQLQRVCIALALACRSRVLVADEPTTALDVVSQSAVLDALSGFTGSSAAGSSSAGSSSAMLFITHDLAVASALCTRALVMESGRIVDEGSMESLLRHPRHDYTKRLVEAARQGLPPLQKQYLRQDKLHQDKLHQDIRA
ncbi:MAG TPA: ATP-binding cassette domain-containing protein [Arthrobacter sp.]|nr:ATP-binding cassette domain-containing protein [Arthrobacter sp.]